MHFDSERRRPRQLGDSATATPSADVDRSRALLTRSASDPGTAGALGPSGLLGASPERNPSEQGPLRNGIEDDRASTIYGSARTHPLTLQELFAESDAESDAELDGYVTAPESDGELDAESEDATRGAGNSRRGSTDRALDPAQESHVFHIDQGARTSADGAASAPQGLWARRGEVYKAGYLLMDSLSPLVASVGWILSRKIPLFRPVGQNLADTLQFTFATLDAAHSGNPIKTAGKAASAIGSAAWVGGVRSTAASRRLNPVAWAGHTLGRGIVAYNAHRAGQPAGASGHFAASAMALMGVIGTTLERFHAASPAFLALEAISNFHTVAPAVGGALQDARDSKVRMPWLRDSKVVANELIAFGTGVAQIASTMSKVYSVKDEEQGSHDSAHFASLIRGLGSAGWFIATIGFSMVMMIELRPSPQPDIEAGPSNSTEAPPPPDAGAGPSGAVV